MLGSWTPSGELPLIVMDESSVILSHIQPSWSDDSFVSTLSSETQSLIRSWAQGLQFKLLETKSGSVSVPSLQTSTSPSAKSDSDKPPSSDPYSHLSLKALDKVLKEYVTSQAAQEFYQEPVLIKFLKHQEGGKASTMPSLNLTSKLNTWGCPACGAFGTFYLVPEYDQYGCEKCKTKFSGIFIEKWDGKPMPQMVGTVPAGVFEDDEDDWDPIVDSSLGAKLLKLKEKVILFREAVVNPDRVTTDEEVERLLKEVFEVSYTLPVGNELDDANEEIDLAPDSYDSQGEYLEQLIHAEKEGIITHQQGIDLFKAFGGDDPFESLPGIPQDMIDEVSGVPEVSKGQVGDIDHLDFAAAEEASLDWIDPFGDT